MDRATCRRCSAGRPSCQRATGGPQQAPAREAAKEKDQAPKVKENTWQTTEAAKASAVKRKKALEAALAAAKAAEGDEDVLKVMNGMLEAIQPPREQPAAETLASTRGYVERQTARLRKLDEELATLQEQRAEMAAELQAALARQAEAEKRIAEEARQGQGVDQQLTTLCSELQALQTLASRKKPRTEEKGERENTQKDESKENVEMAEDAATKDSSQPEAVKMILMQLVNLGAQLQEAISSVAQTQAA